MNGTVVVYYGAVSAVTMGVVVCRRKRFIIQLCPGDTIFVRFPRPPLLYMKLL